LLLCVSALILLNLGRFSLLARRIHD